MPRPVPAAAPDPDLTLLTGADAGDLLSAALAPAGGVLEDWSTRDVDCRPGDRTTATYAARVVWPDGTRSETLAASVSSGGSSRSARHVTAGHQTDGHVTDGEHDVQVWRFPFDPELPALAGACFPGTVAALLRDLGIDSAGPRLQVVSYRPRKRAVVEVITPGCRLYLKVVRPRAAARLHRRHALLTAADVPVARSLGHSDDGLVVLEAVRGTPMRAALDATGATCCDPARLVELLDGLPEEVVSLSRRRPWADHVRHYAEVIAASTDEEAVRAREIADTIAGRLHGCDPGDEATHGDFYEAQVSVADGTVAGLLDVDTLGPGRRSDDLACMLAHLAVVDLMTPGPDGDGVRAALFAWQPAFERRVDPSELRLRTAAVIVSLATGPFRAQEPGWALATTRRLDLAATWTESAACV